MSGPPPSRSTAITYRSRNPRSRRPRPSDWTGWSADGAPEGSAGSATSRGWPWQQSCARPGTCRRFRQSLRPCFFPIRFCNFLRVVPYGTPAGVQASRASSGEVKSGSRRKTLSFLKRCVSSGLDEFRTKPGVTFAELAGGTLEDIQHQVQSHCLELSISLFDWNDHASTASLSLGARPAWPFWPRGRGLRHHPARAVDADSRP